MKKYLAGFGIIMAVGFSFALMGLKGASSILAMILNVTDPAAVTTALPMVVTNTATTTSSITDTASTGTTTSAMTDTATGAVPQTVVVLPAPVRTATLVGLITNQTLQESQVLSVYANEGPVGAKFVITNTTQNDASMIIEAGCVADTTTTDLKSKCTTEIGTFTMTNGKYSIRAYAKYADGEIVATDAVQVNVYNAKPMFTFALVANPVSGMMSINGEITTATEVEFLYSPTNSAQAVRIGNGIYAGGITTSKWTYTWDTTAIPDGTYQIIAHVKNRYNNLEPYKAGEITVSIQNRTDTIELTVPYMATTSPSTTTAVVSTPVITQQAKERFPTGEPLQRILVNGATTSQSTSSSEASSDSGQVTVVPEKENERASEGRAATLPEPIRVIPAPVVAIPVPPVVQRIQDIAIGIQSGTDAAAVEHKVAALQKELWGEVNPGSPAVQASMQYQSAKEFGTTVDTTVMRVATIALSTTTVETIVSITTTTAKGEKVVIKEKRQVVTEKIRLTGKALPNMYVTLYIYSEIPTIAVVKADRNGNWVYELDNKLDEGKHEAYVTINDRTGKIVAKSALFGFVKTAEAITVDNVGMANIGELPDKPIQPVQAAKRTYGMIVFAIIAGGLLIGILLVVRSFKRKEQI